MIPLAGLGIDDDGRLAGMKVSDELLRNLRAHAILQPQEMQWPFAEVTV